jgi:putative transcriptional regulator
MSGKRIIESMKEALSISKGELSPETYKIHIPKSVDVKAIKVIERVPDIVAGV